MHISDWSSDVCSSDLSKGRPCLNRRKKTSASTSSARTEEGAGMTAARKTALVVAPGRGTYGKAELGSIARLHGERLADRIADFDAQLRTRGQPTVTDLDDHEHSRLKVNMSSDVAEQLQTRRG